MTISLREATGMLARLDDQAERLVLMTQPSMVKGWWKGQTPHLFTMWETDVLPAHFRDYLSQFKKVLVPCEHNRVLFSQWHDDVVTVPLGVDTALWAPTERKPNTKLRILAGGSHWIRKGLDAVIRAFLEVNPPNCELVIKTIPDVIGKIPIVPDPRITVIVDYLSPEQERELYRSADLFIAASRGEGWGLMPLQAITAGIPTLVSDTSGHREFLHLAAQTIKTTPVPANLPPLYTLGMWDEPDHQSLVDGITWFLDEPEKAKQRGLECAALADQFSWAKAARRLITEVGLGGVVAQDEWQEATLIRIPLRVKRRVRADIGKFSVDLAPGITHMVPVNVRDVIVEAGLAVENQ